jgi:xanthine/uracil permease
MLSGAVGGSGVTTYAENIGVMAVTKVYSTLVFVAAAAMAMLLGFSPKFGALIHTIPGRLSAAHRLWCLADCRRRRAYLGAESR